MVDTLHRFTPDTRQAPPDAGSQISATPAPAPATAAEATPGGVADRDAAVRAAMGLLRGRLRLATTVRAVEELRADLRELEQAVADRPPRPVTAGARAEDIDPLLGTAPDAGSVEAQLSQVQGAVHARWSRLRALPTIPEMAEALDVRIQALRRAVRLAGCATGVADTPTAPPVPAWLEAERVLSAQRVARATARARVAEERRRRAPTTARYGFEAQRQRAMAAHAAQYLRAVAELERGGARPPGLESCPGPVADGSARASGMVSA